MGKLNFNNFISRERNLDRIIRFSAHKRIKDQSVSEHSFHAALYAMILADIEEKNFKHRINREKILKSVILHDLEECLTGDIIYSFKYTDKKLFAKIKEIGQKLLADLFRDLPAEMSGEYLNLWTTAKDKNTIEGKIVESADKLEGLFYAIDELSLGNKEFKPIIANYLELLDKIDLGSVRLILKTIKTNI
jgi:5'-deoxynucleotidase YfbR-like HD superfamily hydrolase